MFNQANGCLFISFCYQDVMAESLNIQNLNKTFPEYEN